MASPILSALTHGYGARVILNQIMRRYPEHASKIIAAEAAGYAGNQILKSLDKKSKDTSEDDYLTEHEKTQKRDIQQKRKAAMQVLGTIGTAGAIGAGAYAYSQRNKALRGEILPAIPNPPKQEFQRYLPPGQQRLALPGPRDMQNRPQQPQGPIQPAPYYPEQEQQQEPPQQPQPSQQPEPPKRDILKSVDLVRNVRAQNHVENMIDHGYGPVQGALILRAVMPKNIISILDKAEGGLERLIEDYSEHMQQESKVAQETAQTLQKQEQQQQERARQEQPLTQRPENLRPQEVPQEMPQMRSREQEQGVQPAQVARQEVMTPENQRPVVKQEMPVTRPEEIIAEKVNQPVPSKELAILPKGQVGQIESIKNGVAKVNVNGNIINEKLSNIEKEPPDLESAVRKIINSIPEDAKSTSLQSVVHVPIAGLNLMLAQFYDGKWAWYRDVSEDLYRQIAMGTFEPKTEGITGIAKYKPGVVDSRGAGFSSEISRNPKYSKETKGVMWDYASNEYALMKNIQHIIHKISKEKLDEQGNVVEPKKRKKQSK